MKKEEKKDDRSSLEERVVDKTTMTLFLHRAGLAGFLFVLGLLSASPAMADGSSKSGTVAVADALGRKVEIRLPLERVVTVNTSSAVILRALGVDVESKVVGVTDYIPENPRFWPKLKDKPVIEYKNPSYERLAELAPQLVLFYDNSPKFTQEEKLGALGIQWLYLDCFDPGTLACDVRLLGSLFGKEKEAEKLIAWLMHHEHAITSRLQGAPVSKSPKVFFFQYPDYYLPKGVYNTIGRHGSGHPLIAKAGGDNLAADLPMESPKVSAEWIAESNPEAIIAGVLGKDFSGYSADAAAAEENLKDVWRRLAEDRALKETDAVRNRRILVLSHDVKQGPAYVVGMAYIAKFLYPELFRDVMPESIAREYFEKWCGLPYRGVFAYSLLEGFWNGGEPAKERREKSVIVTDGVGRRVEVPYPLKRVAAASGSYGPETILALGAGDRLAGVGEYAKLHALHISPLLEGVPGVGLKEPSAEKILEIAPQAVVFYECYYPYPDSLMNALEEAGISALMMDFHRPEVFDRHIRIMGRLLEKEQRAEEMIAFEKKYLDLIDSRVAGIADEDKPRVYVEQYYDLRTATTANPDHVLLNRCGGIGIFNDLPLSGTLTAYISSESVIERNPDVIVKQVGTSGIYRSGYGATDASQLEEARNRIMKRPGWDQIKAVKNGRVYVLNTETKATHPSVYCSYLARWLHPGLFEDLDAADIYRMWMEDFLNIEYKGVYAFPEKPVDRKGQADFDIGSYRNRGGRGH